MLERVHNALALLRAQLWIVPAMMSAVAVVLAVMMIRYDQPFIGAFGSGAWWLFSGDPATARNLLAALLSGLMTMTSLVVSMTFVILSLASSQLGPRIVSSFISDRQI